VLGAVVVAAAACWLVLALARDDGPRVIPRPASSRPVVPATPATPATLGKVFRAAKGGDTIELAPGRYRTFSGGRKCSRVTLRPRERGTVNMALRFRRAVNVRVEGMVLRSVEIAGRSRRVEVANSRFTGPALIRAGRMVDAGIVLEGNRHRNIDVCDGCFEGRVHVTGRAGGPAGITIRRSVFGPGGNADGIQTGGNGVRILRNDFVGIQASGGVHTDAIQLYGSRGTVIRGNWIRDSATGIVAPDGADHEIIENNLIDPGSYPFAISIGSDDGSVIRHNTLPAGACAFDLRCGIVSLGAKTDGARGRGTVVRDNVLSEVSVTGGAGLAEKSDNLLARDRVRPRFAGSLQADTWDGFRLASGSPGKAAASDGADVGITARSAGS